jgi:hypothetical protein
VPSWLERRPVATDVAVLPPDAAYWRRICASAFEISFQAYRTLVSSAAATSDAVMPSK